MLSCKRYSWKKMLERPNICTGLTDIKYDNLTGSPVNFMVNQTRPHQWSGHTILAEFLLPPRRPSISVSEYFWLICSVIRIRIRAWGTFIIRSPTPQSGWQDFFLFVKTTPKYVERKWKWWWWTLQKSQNQMGDHQHGLGVLSACGGGGGQLWWQVLLSLELIA